MEEPVLINYDSNEIQASGYQFYPSWETLSPDFAAENGSGVSSLDENQSRIPRESVRKNRRETDCKRVGKRDVKCSGKEKEMGPDCGCPGKCYEKVGEDTVRKIFHDFWALADYNSQNAYLFGLINLIGVKRRYTKKETSRRNFTVTYSVKKKGQNVTVCKKAFLNIHGLQRNRGRVNNLTNKMKEGESVPSPDRRGRHTNRPNAYSEEAIEHVRRHLLRCPRKKGSKQMGVSTKRCYELYANGYCKEKGLIPVSLDKFRRIFTTEGYKNRCRGFHKSRK